MSLILSHSKLLKIGSGYIKELHTHRSFRDNGASSRLGGLPIRLGLWVSIRWDTPFGFDALSSPDSVEPESESSPDATGGSIGLKKDNAITEAF